jgi:hypothetical protein
VAVDQAEKVEANSSIEKGNGEIDAMCERAIGRRLVIVGVRLVTVGQGPEGRWHVERKDEEQGCEALREWAS